MSGLEKQIEEDEAKGGMFRPWDPNDDGAMMPSVFCSMHQLVYFTDFHQDNNEWLWNRILSPTDRLFLGANKINSGQLSYVSVIFLFYSL